MCPRGLELVEVIGKFILLSCSLCAACAIKGELRSSDCLPENALVLTVSGGLSSWKGSAALKEKVRKGKKRKKVAVDAGRSSSSEDCFNSLFSSKSSRHEQPQSK